MTDANHATPDDTAPSARARAVLRVTGSDRIKFLQGLVTNDVTRLQKHPEAAIYAALLNAQGKLIVDFFLIADGDSILVDVAASAAGDLRKKLTMYKLRADVGVEMTALRVSFGDGPAPEGAFDDPRHRDLGWRAYDGREDAQTSDPDARRIDAATPHFGVDLMPGDYILEMGFERLNGVDFKKGCYVGQEVTARMKHKTELRKGLVRVELDGRASTGDTITNAGDKDVGRLLSVHGDRALAYLRFDRVDEAMRAGDARVHLPASR